MGFQQIKSRRIYEEIIDQVKAQINSGDLKPGDRMPSERDIAERLGVGRAAVREALTALEVMGLLEVRTGEGTFVRAPGLDEDIAPLTTFLMLERERLAEVHELRKVFEVGCAGLAAVRASVADLDAIGQIIREMEEDVRLNRLGDETDFRFHMTVARATGNSFMIRFMHTVADSLRQVLQSSRTRLYLIPGMPERLLEEHRRIYEAIAMGEPEMAEQAMRDHLDGVGQGLRLD